MVGWGVMRNEGNGGSQEKRGGGKRMKEGGVWPSEGNMNFSTG